MMELPAVFIEKYQRLLGSDEAPAFFESFEQPAETGFRINPKKTTSKQLADYQRNFEGIPWSPLGFYGKSRGHSLPQVSGAVYSQEPSAQAVAALADPKPQTRVLDLCAAPGGKTTQLASLLAETGLLVANEIDGQRVKVLSENVERFGDNHVVVTNHDPDRLAELLPHFFDLIVIDAPCSGEGMFRKDPNATQYWSPDYVQQCQDRQRLILTAALKMLRPNGQLVYSTCTFSPEENEQNISWLLEQYPALSTIAPEQTWPNVDTGRPEWADGNEQLRHARRFWPHHLRGEGHFMVKLQAHDLTIAVQSETASTNSSQPARRQKGTAQKNRRGGTRGRGNSQSQTQQIHLNRVQQDLLSQFINATFVQTPVWASLSDKWQLELHGDQLFAVPAELVDHAGLKFVRRGLWIGEFRKQRFVPNHALVMATPVSEFIHVVELADADLEHYLHGEALRLNTELTKGWYPVASEQRIFSWGYLVDGTLKNFYPKNLRF